MTRVISDALSKACGPVTKSSSSIVVQPTTPFASPASTAPALRISEPNTSIPAHFARARHEWVFCLLPTETLTESLEASLFEWKLYSSGDIAHIPSAAVVVKDEAKNSAGGKRNQHPPGTKGLGSMEWSAAPTRSAQPPAAG